MKTGLLLIALGFANTTYAIEEIQPLAIDGDAEAKVKSLSKSERIQYGKYLTQSICKNCHHKNFAGKSFFENDDYLRENLLARPKNLLAITMRSKMSHQQMPPDNWEKLEKYQWQSVYDYVHFIEEDLRKTP